MWKKTMCFLQTKMKHQLSLPLLFFNIWCACVSVCVCACACVFLLKWPNSRGQTTEGWGWRGGGVEKRELGLPWGPEAGLLWHSDDRRAWHGSVGEGENEGRRTNVCAGCEGSQSKIQSYQLMTFSHFFSILHHILSKGGNQPRQYCLSPKRQMHVQMETQSITSKIQSNPFSVMGTHITIIMYI